jgi:hypothetical protein
MTIFDVDISELAGDSAELDRYRGSVLKLLPR